MLNSGRVYGPGFVLSLEKFEFDPKFWLQQKKEQDHMNSLWSYQRGISENIQMVVMVCFTSTPEISHFEPPNGGGWKMMFLLNWAIYIRFHVNFQGCIEPFLLGNSPPQSPHHAIQLRVPNKVPLAAWGFYWVKVGWKMFSVPSTSYEKYAYGPRDLHLSRSTPLKTNMTLEMFHFQQEMHIQMVGCLLPC